MTATQKKAWLSGRAAQLRLGVSNYELLRMAVRGEVRTLVEPGRFIKYNAGDVDRLAAKANQPAKPSRRRPQPSGA